MKSTIPLALTLCAVTLAAPLASQAADWDGLYGGIHVGSSSDDTKQEVSGGVGSSSSIDVSGGVYGAQIGYNETISENFVAGFEAYYSLSDADGTAATCPGVYTRCSVAVDWTTSARARFGWAGSNLFLYGTVGIAYAQVKLSSNFASDRKNIQGYLVGVGAETFLNKVVSIKLEAIRTNYNSNDFSIGGGNTAQADLAPLEFLLAVNFRFR